MYRERDVHTYIHTYIHMYIHTYIHIFICITYASIVDYVTSYLSRLEHISNSNFLVEAWRLEASNTNDNNDNNDINNNDILIMNANDDNRY